MVDKVYIAKVWGQHGHVYIVGVAPTLEAARYMCLRTDLHTLIEDVPAYFNVLEHELGRFETGRLVWSQDAEQ